MSDLPSRDENQPDRESTSAGPVAKLVVGAVGAYLALLLLLFLDELVFGTFFLQRSFPQLATPVRILYYPFLWIGSWLGLLTMPPIF